MFRFTLLIFFFDRLRPLLAAPDVTDRPDLPERADLEPDLCDLADFCLRTDFVLDLDLLDSFLALLLLLPRFLLPLLLLRPLREERLPFRELMLLVERNFLAEDRFFECEREERRPRADVGMLLLAERYFRVACSSAIIPFIARFLRLLSVASISSAALSSKFCENSSTRLLNCETAPFLISRSSQADDCSFACS